HDRIHFDHPDEMTAGDPPAPAIALGPDSQILAQRLVAKEVLRRAFRFLGETWRSSGTPPDPHGEMGSADACDDRRLEQLKGWLIEQHAEVERIAHVVARGSGQDATALVSAAQALPERIR